MLNILPISLKIQKLLRKYQLQKKFEKQLKLLAENPKHSSLHLELLEPKHLGIYSFRVDRKFRTILIFRPDKNSVEILNLTVHYR